MLGTFSLCNGMDGSSNLDGVIFSTRFLLALCDDWVIITGFWLEVNVICDHGAYTLVVLNISVNFHHRIFQKCWAAPTGAVAEDCPYNIYFLTLIRWFCYQKKYRGYISDATSSHNNLNKVDPPFSTDIALQFKNLTRQLWIADLDIQAMKNQQ
jgi:hypothetical protein